jgi:hypothetical protein
MDLRTATVRFLHSRPTFCLVTEMGKQRFHENYLRIIELIHYEIYEISCHLIFGSFSMEHCLNALQMLLRQMELLAMGL